MTTTQYVCVKCTRFENVLARNSDEAGQAVAWAGWKFDPKRGGLTCPRCNGQKRQNLALPKNLVQ